MRRGFAITVLVFVAAARASGEDAKPASPPPGSPAPTPAAIPFLPAKPEPVADAVLAAVAAKDDAALKALAGKDGPDPWIVADELIRRGAFDAAEAFAKAAPRVEVEMLPAYVASRRGKPDDAAARDALVGMNRALEAKDFPAALAALGPADAAPPADVVGVRLAFARGIALQGLNRLEEGANTYLAAADAAERLGWRFRAAMALHRGGICAQDRSDYRRAVAMWERGLRLCELLGNGLGIAQAVGNLGLAYGAIGLDAKSLEYTLRAVGLVEALGNRPVLAVATQSLGLAYNRVANYPKALETFGRAMKLMQELGDRHGVAVVLGNFGSVHHALGNYAKALEYGERALKQAQELGDRGGAAGVLVNIGLVYRDLGSFAKALEYIERGLAEAEASAERQWVANALNNLGLVHRDLGDPTKALDYYSRALKKADELGDRGGVAGGLINIAGAVSEFGDDAKALEYYERGRAESVAIGQRAWEANALSGIGHTLSSLGEPAKALAHFERALELKQTLGDRAGVAAALVSLGGAYAALKDTAKAIQLFERAARSAEKLGANDLHVDALSALARTRLRAGDSARALPDAHLAVSLLRNLVGGLGEEQGAMARERYARLFATGLAAAAKENDAAEAAFFLESGRAGTMLESLDARDAMRRAAIPEALRLAQDEARAAERRALLAHAEAEEGGDLALVRAREKDLMAARSKVQEAAERIQREAKKAASLWYPVASPLEDVQGFLGAGEALVLYGLAEEGEVYALVLTRQEARIVALGKSAAIAEACNALAASDPDADPSGALGRLRELLLSPLALPKETTRLLVSPDGPIGYVPFAALVPGLDVAYQMSGTTYGVLREEKDKRGEQVLALADADYSAKFNRIALDLYAPLAAATPTRGGRLSPLPGTREEAKAIADVALYGGDASEPGLRAALAKKKDRWHAVHFACHGLVNPNRPTLSSLALTPQGEDDGFLTALEVLKMEIPSDLVVLSACETGKGKIVGGEGIVGLTRAFMYAGAPRVICSLWKVDDDATRALMTKFYELWNPKDGKPGLPTAEALRKAQEYVKSQEKWKHPYYWAAWVLWGLPE